MSYFWNNFYKNKKSRLNPSNFAKYCVKNFFTRNKSILDIGCGNGRDSFYFKKKKLIVTGVDKSKVIIEQNLSKNIYKDINFIAKDINDRSFNKIGKFHFIYARFFLHTIDKKSEKKLFNNFVKIGYKKKTKVFLEFRTIKDPLKKRGRKISSNETFTDHYRRFIEVESLIKKLKKMKNLKIINVIEKKGLARFGNENPVVCRLILKIL